MKIWEPKPPGTLWSTPGLLRDDFTLYKYACYKRFQAKCKYVKMRHLLLLLLVFSPWASLGRSKSPIRRPVWLWYATSWASS